MIMKDSAERSQIMQLCEASHTSSESSMITPITIQGMGRWIRRLSITCQGHASLSEACIVSRGITTSRSDVEQMPWSIGGIATVIVPAVAVFVVVLERFGKPDTRGIISLACLLLGTIPSTAARLCIITVAFSCLRLVPLGLYHSTWAQYFPTVQ